MCVDPRMTQQSQGIALASTNITYLVTNCYSMQLNAIQGLTISKSTLNLANRIASHASLSGPSAVRVNQSGV